MKTILAPVDFSPATAGVIAEALALAPRLRARIVFLSVVQPPVVMTDYAPLLENIAEAMHREETAVAKRLAKLRSEAVDASVGVETEIAAGSPVQAIVDAARKFTADYIVMGSHGHTAFYDLVVGSTTHGVMQRAGCPVIIVPPGARGSAKIRRGAIRTAAK